MKLTIELEKDDIMWFITELEAKGCLEVAKAIEDAYSKEMALDLNRQILAEFKENWTRGYFFKHNNGNVTAVYFNYKTKKFHYGPIYISGKLMGSPSTLSAINEKVEMLKEVGFKEA